MPRQSRLGEAQRFLRVHSSVHLFIRDQSCEHDRSTSQKCKKLFFGDNCEGIQFNSFVSDHNISSKKNVIKTRKATWQNIHRKDRQEYITLSLQYSAIWQVYIFT